jgi:hypothetical protein
MGNPITLLKGLGLGAGLMYLFDPQMGRRRRVMLGDQVTHLCNEACDLFDEGTRDMKNRALGVAAEARSHLTPDDADSRTIVARVRSAMGRCCSHPRAITVTCRDGAVTLAGPVLASEVDGLLQAVSNVRGVREVVDRLQIHQQPGDHPSLQGGRMQPGERSELWQENWSPATKLMLGTAGAVAGLALIRRSGLMLPALGLLGAAYAVARSEGDPLETFGEWGERAVSWGREWMGGDTGSEADTLGTGTGPVQRTGSVSQ